MEQKANGAMHFPAHQHPPLSKEWVYYQLRRINENEDIYSQRVPNQGNLESVCANTCGKLESERNNPVWIFYRLTN